MVYLSGVSMPVNQLLKPARMPEPTVDSRRRRTVYFTSSLVSSRPEWYWTPLRRLSLNCLKSVLISQLSASIGCGWRLASYWVRRSKTSHEVSLPPPAMLLPSMLTGLAVCAKRSVPPALGWPAAGCGAEVGATAGCGAVVAAGADVVTGGAAAGTGGEHAATSAAPAPRLKMRNADRRFNGEGMMTSYDLLFELECGKNRGGHRWTAAASGGVPLL